MKIVEIKKIADFIYLNFTDDLVLLVDWLYSNIDSFKTYSEQERELILEQLGDQQHKDHERLISALEKKVKTAEPSNRIDLLREVDGAYLKLSKLGENVNSTLEQEIFVGLEKIAKLGNMEKGIFFEKFCANFLCDLGLDAEVTRATNDKGIDIKASYHTNLEEELSSFVFDDKIYLLAQAKFLSSKVDTPVIRALVGDSILLKFNDVEYVEISHNAVHLMVFSHSGFTDEARKFARKHKIKLIETHQLVSIIAASNIAGTWRCVYCLREKVSELDALD